MTTKITELADYVTTVGHLLSVCSPEAVLECDTEGGGGACGSDVTYLEKEICDAGGQSHMVVERTIAVFLRTFGER